MSVWRKALLGLAAGVPLMLAATGANAWWWLDRGSLKDGAPFSWTGLYVGSHYGVGMSNLDWNAAGNDLGQTATGFLTGNQIGYNVQTGGVVIGIEADGTWARLLESKTACPNPAFDCRQEVNWLASVRGKLGMTFNANRTMAYATGGYAWGSFDYSATPAAGGFSADNVHTGWVAGLGIEHAFAARWTAKFEYLFYNFSDDLVGTAGRFEPEVHVVRIGTNYKF